MVCNSGDVKCVMLMYFNLKFYSVSPVTELTEVALRPVRGLLPGHGHVPAHHPPVLSGADQPRVGGAVDQAGHLAPVPVQLIHCAPPTPDVPHKHRGVITGGVKPVPCPVPGQTLDTAAVTL